MMRLIDADALMERLKEWDTDDKVDRRLYNFTLNRVLEQPTIEPERKTGRWVYGEDNSGTGRDGWFCSKCGHFEMWDYSADMKSAELNLPNFCPNCGAAMIEEGAQDG